MTAPPVDPPASPVCSPSDASDGYMGYLNHDELAAALNQLLEAERAGAWVGARLLRMAASTNLEDVARTLQRDEAHWCAMLTKALKRLGAEPSKKVGAFYDKTLAISGLEARLAFVMRGQAWVVRTLQLLLPKIRDDQLHADLRAMLEAHVSNIELTDRALGRTAGGRAT